MSRKFDNKKVQDSFGRVSLFVVRNQHFVLNRVNRDVKVFVKDYKGNKVVTHTEDCLLAQTKLSSSLSKRVNSKSFSCKDYPQTSNSKRSFGRTHFNQLRMQSNYYYENEVSQHLAFASKHYLLTWSQCHHSKNYETNKVKDSLACRSSVYVLKTCYVML